MRIRPVVTSFEMTAMVAPLVFGPLDVAVDFWAKVRAGTMVQRPDLLDDVWLITGGAR